MQEPIKRDEEPGLKPLPDQPSSALSADEETTYGGGGGGSPLMRDSSGLWVICVFGVILVAISLVALSKDPATATYRQPLHIFSLGDWRIKGELLLLVIGSGCFATAVACLRAQSQARKLEKGAEGRLKSLRAKRLEKLSDESILGIIGNYIAALLGLI